MDTFYYAKLDENNFVVNVEASGENCPGVEQELDELNEIDNEYTWLQTWRDGEHRGRFAMIGGTYDPASDRFIDKSPESYPSWVLQEDGSWFPPTPMPSNYTQENWPSESGEYKEAHRFTWDEESVSWVLYIFPEQTDAAGE
jgi:hypothetical protein